MPPIPTLSRRQAQISSMLIEGSSIQDIMVYTGLKKGTIKRHIHETYAKLGIHSAIELVEILSGGTPHRGRGRVEWIKRQLTTRDRGECWIWPFPLHHTGYAFLIHQGKRTLVHNLVYELETGVSIRENQTVFHACMASACFNPNHISTR